MDNKTYKTSFALSDECKSLLEQLAGRYCLSKTGVIEMLIRARVASDQIRDAIIALESKEEE